MAKLNAPLKPLILAIATTTISANAFSAACDPVYSIQTQEDLDTAFAELVGCPKVETPYKIEFSEALSGEELTMTGNYTVDNNNLIISGPNSAETTIRFVQNADTQSYGFAFVSAIDSSHLKLENLILDGNSLVDAKISNPLLRVSNSKLELNNVTVENFHLNQKSAIKSENNSDLVITDSVFKNNSTTQNGAAIDSQSGSFVIEDSIFENNISDGNGGAINVEDIAELSFTGDIRSSVFDNNKAHNGGAIKVEGINRVELEIRDSVFKNNNTHSHISGRGGAVNVINTELNINKSSFINNHANNRGVSGAISYQSDTSNELRSVIDKSTFIDNSANFCGAIGIYALKDDIIINETLVKNNTSIDYSGEGSSTGGICISGAKSISIDRSLFSGNYSEEDIGSFSVYGDETSSTFLLINNTSFLENSAYVDISTMRLNRVNGKISNSTFLNNDLTAQNISSGNSIIIDTGESNIEIENTVISGKNVSGSEICNLSTNTVSIKNSFIGNGTDSNANCTVNINYTDSQVGTSQNQIDPMLSKFIDNGDYTSSYYPDINSPLIDAGDINYIEQGLDQRGGNRIHNSRVDIGSVEYLGEFPERNLKLYTTPEFSQFTEMTLNINQYFTSVDGVSLNYQSFDLPDELSLDFVTGEITGIPSVSGETVFVVDVITEYGLSIEWEFDFNVLIQPTLTELMFEQTIISNDVAVNLDMSQYYTASNESELNYSATSLPSGFQIDPQSGVISGSTDEYGLKNINVQAQSIDGLFVDSDFEFTLISSPEISSNNESNLAFAVGSILNFEVSNYFISTDEALLSYDSNNLPEGLLIDSENGKIYGQVNESGDHLITITALSEYGLSVDHDLNLIFVNIPSLTNEVFEDTDILLNESVYLEFSQYFTSIDGHKLSYAAMDLPAGLTLDSGTGVVYGNATQEGQVVFVITASDEFDLSVEKEFIMTILSESNEMTLTKTDSQTQTMSSIETQTLSDVETQTGSAEGTQTESDVETQSNTGTQTDTDLFTQSNMDTQTQTQTQTQTNTDLDAGPEAQTDTQTDSNTKSGGSISKWFISMFAILLFLRRRQN